MSIAESFCRSPFAQFVNSPVGRIARVVAGCALIVWGYMNRSDSTGIILMVAGTAPLVTGSLNLCLIGALLGAPLSGRAYERR